MGRNLGGPSPYEDILHRDLFFAAQCLADQDVDVNVCIQLIDQFFSVLLNHDPSIFDPMSTRADRIVSALTGSSAERTLLGQLLNALQDTSSAVRGRAVSALGSATDQPEVVTALLKALQDATDEVRDSAASALGTATDQPEVVTALLKALQDASGAVRGSAALCAANCGESARGRDGFAECLARCK